MLNVAALLVLIASIVGAGALLRRALRRAQALAPSQCARCGTPGEELVDFTCPGCGRDVREHGLVTPAERSPAIVLGRFATASGMVAAAALLAFGGALLFLPDERHFHAEGQLSPSGSRPGAAPMPWNAIHVTAEGRGGANRHEDVGKPGLRPVRGRADVEIQLPDGRWSTLRLEWPSRRARVRAPNGGPMTDAGTFGPAALRTWFASAGADVESADVQSRVDDLHSFLERLMTAGRFPNLYRDNQSGFSWGGSWGGSSDMPEWIWPAQLLVWPAVWLLAVMWMLRERLPAWGGGSLDGGIDGTLPGAGGVA